MKLCTYHPASTDNSSPAARLGAVVSDDILDVGSLAAAGRTNEPPWSTSMQSLLEADLSAWKELHELVRRAGAAKSASDADEHRGRPAPSAAWTPLGEATLLAPLPRPNSLRDCLSFEQHWVQAARNLVGAKLPPAAWLDRGWQQAAGWSLLRPPRVWRQRPVYYKGNRMSVVGPGADVIWPSYSRRLDFELEIAFYIGQGGVDIDRAAAMQHVAGYSLFNDFSARDVQFQEMRARLGPSKSKDFDTGNSLGPCLVTPDEVDLASMRLTAEVNGEIWSESTAESLEHSVAETIALISADETLYPGDVIALGTVPGGCGLELNRWLQPGDRVKLAATGLGELENQVLAPQSSHHPLG